jgi:F0F1-type ATP synthase membrane subunit b/b'
MKNLIIVNLIMINSVQAAGGDNHVSALIYPAINFAVFLMAIIYFTKSKLDISFKNKYKKIMNDSERAANKEKESKAMLDMFQKKIENLEKEIKSIKKESVTKIKEFNQSFLDEISSKSEQIKENSVKQVENEKQNKIKSIHESFMDKIIDNTKMTINTESKVSKKTTEKLIREL